MTELSTIKEDETIGYIYCLSNPSFEENVYKIGFTKNDPKFRMKQLNTTGIPEPFKLELYKKVKNCEFKEKKIHKILSKYR